MAENSDNLGLNTICTHFGELEDKQFKGVVSPIFTSTSYAYEGVDVKRYPRYFNTPNQEALCKKIARLEHAEAALLFSSGMAAISTTLLSFLKSGDHVVLQKTVYGGTFNLVSTEFDKYGISYTFTDGYSKRDFESVLQENTKVIYIESPSNPLLEIIDLEMIAKIAKKRGIITMIDNTFASPINQNPIDFGIDVCIHSATKYLGGHSDICAGAVASSEAIIKEIWKKAITQGGNLSDYTVWLLERSIKTLGIRVKVQNRNAKKLAKWLNNHRLVKKVYYPGLKSNENYKLAKRQMHGYGGMLSFELVSGIDPTKFMDSLVLVKKAMSLAGVESTILSPSKTSHSLLSEEERKRQGIQDGLLRFSLGIEDRHDIIADFEQAFELIVEKVFENIK